MPIKKPITKTPEAQGPIILRLLRILEAFAKANEERDFYLDRKEGFILYSNLDKSEEELTVLFNELEQNKERYIPIPKLTLYEAKKLMESFVHDKVYDIDTKDKLLGIISAHGARENFLEFLYDHMHDFEKWQQFYQERFRIHIIEWLRSFHIHFVFEEDLELPTPTIESLRRHLFETKVPKDVEVARKALETKAKMYYSNDALNPRPKRGRPPKQQAKVEVTPKLSIDIYTTVPSGIRPFLFTPDLHSFLDASFSSIFEEEKQATIQPKKRAFGQEETLAELHQKLEELREMSKTWVSEKVVDTKHVAHEINKGERKRLRRKISEPSTTSPKKSAKKNLQRLNTTQETTQEAKKSSAKRRLKRSN